MNTVLGWLKHKMPVVWHQLIGKDLARIAFESFGEDSLEGIVVRRFMENRGSRIATIQGVIDPTRFVRSFRSSHSNTVK